MSLGFGLYTVGAILLYTTLKRMTISDLLLGRPSEGNLFQTAAELAKEKGIKLGAGVEQWQGILKPGIGTFEGERVCNWIIPYLKEARRKGWKGKVRSGYRSKADQKRVCATGVTPCAEPGKSMHQGKSYPRCAIDVTEPDQLERIFMEIGAPLRRTVPNDPVHFSTGG